MIHAVWTDQVSKYMLFVRETTITAAEKEEEKNQRWQQHKGMRRRCLPWIPLLVMFSAFLFKKRVKDAWIMLSMKIHTLILRGKTILTLPTEYWEEKRKNKLPRRKKWPTGLKTLWQQHAFGDTKEREGKREGNSIFLSCTTLVTCQLHFAGRTMIGVSSTSRPWVDRRVGVGQGRDTVSRDVCISHSWRRRWRQILKVMMSWSLFKDFVISLGVDVVFNQKVMMRRRRVTRRRKVDPNANLAKDVIILQSKFISRHQLTRTGLTRKAVRVIHLVSGSHHKVILVKTLRTFATLGTKQPEGGMHSMKFLTSSFFVT